MSDTCGPTFYAPLGKWDRDSQSWKTSEATSLWALTLSSLTLPTWGGLHDGELFEHPTPGLHISGRDYSSLPTPSANDTTGAESREQRDNRRAGGQMLRDLPTMLPTPTTQDAANTAGPSQMRRNTLPLNAAVELLPTPAVNDMGEGKTLEWWDDWAPRQKSSDGRPAPHGRSLAIEAMRMLPTPTTEHSSGGYNPAWGHGMTLLDAAKEIAGQRGATTAPPLPDGNTSPDDPHQPRLNLDAPGIPA
jgi:hypothetical protein